MCSHRGHHADKEDGSRHVETQQGIATDDRRQAHQPEAVDGRAAAPSLVQFAQGHESDQGDRLQCTTTQVVLKTPTTTNNSVLTTKDMVPIISRERSKSLK